MKYWARLDLIKMKLKTFVTVILIAIVAGACSPSTPATPTQDVNAVYTQAALLVATQFSMLQTQTAMAVPPTAQATPTLPAIISTLPVFGTPGTPIVPFGFTPIATVIATLPSGGTGSTANGCNDSQFISETIPDKTVMKPAEKFEKVWQMMNSGTCAWNEGYTWAFIPNDSTAGFIGYDIVYKTGDAATEPKHSQSFVLKFTAPTTPGEYKGYWKMKDKAGNFFGTRVYVWIIVK
jgi:hypothetical protein